MNYLMTLAITIIGALFVFYLNSSSPDVRYTLSDRIPISLLSSSETRSENVQQLEVKNVGNAPAEEIQVVINGEIVKSYIVKQSEMDSPKEIIKSDMYELRYLELPVNGAFKLVFTSSGEITSSNLAVSHRKGSASPALASSSNVYYSIFMILVVVLYFILSLNEGRKAFLNMRISSLMYKPLDAILNTTCSSFIPERLWNGEYLESLKKLLSKRHYEDDLNNFAAFELLEFGKPDHMSESTWKILVEQATDSVTREYHSIV